MSDLRQILIRIGCLSALAGSLVIPSGALAEQRITIGTGSKTGVYYALGTAMCEAFKRNNPSVACFVKETKGSVENAARLQKGEIQFGILQSDIQFKAISGKGVFKKTGALKNLRALFSTHRETLALVARRDSGIQTLSDLPGKAINIGALTTGTNGTMINVMRTHNWTKTTFSKIEQLAPRDQEKALCSGRIAATAFLAGHPNSLVSKLLNTCDARLVSATGPGIDRLIRAEPYYVPAIIPKGAYKGITADVRSIGLLATVMAGAKVPDAMVYEMTASVFGNLNLIKRKHRSLRYLQRIEMSRLGMTAPRHAGAQRYFVEAGLLQ